MFRDTPARVLSHDDPECVGVAPLGGAVVVPALLTRRHVDQIMTRGSDHHSISTSALMLASSSLYSQCLSASAVAQPVM